MKADVVPSNFEWKTKSVLRKLPTARQILHTKIRNENMHEDEQMMDDVIQISQDENVPSSGDKNRYVSCFKTRLFRVKIKAYCSANGFS